MCYTHGLRAAVRRPCKKRPRNFKALEWRKEDKVKEIKKTEVYGLLNVI